MLVPAVEYPFDSDNLPYLMQGAAGAAGMAHNHDYGGAIPPPATYTV